MIDFATCRLPELIVFDEFATCVVQQGRPSPGQRSVAGARFATEVPIGRETSHKGPVGGIARRWFPQDSRHHGLTELVDDEGITTR